MSKTSAVSFTVDLGEAALVSGFQSQGPPRSKHGEDYLRYVGLRVLLSDDGRRWRDCCEDRQELFYADDRGDSANVIKTHSFGAVQAARFVRIVVSAGVRWIGHEQKCFRLESC